MDKEYRIILVHNKSKKIIGTVVDLQSSGFRMIYRLQESDMILLFHVENIYELLNQAKEHNATIYYFIGSVYIPLTPTTYEKRQYLDKVGWNKLTPAEAVLFGTLSEAKHIDEKWLSTEQLQEVLSAFGFRPTSLRMLLAKLRKKLENTSLRVKNRNRVGYRLIDMENDLRDELLMKESCSKSDYLILFCDKKLKHIVEIDSTEAVMAHLNKQLAKENIWRNRPGSEILRGWQGLTSTEAEIFFELVKRRGEYVDYKFLLTLPWTSRYGNDEEVLKYSLRNFISKIRSKIADTNQEIHTKHGFGYRLI